MSKLCEICGKGYLRANQVPRGIGNRVTKRTTIKQQPNLRSKKFQVNGVNVRIQLCSSCLKKIKNIKTSDNKAQS